MDSNNFCEITVNTSFSQILFVVGNAYLEYLNGGFDKSKYYCKRFFTDEWRNLFFLYSLIPFVIFSFNEVFINLYFTM